MTTYVLVHGAWHGPWAWDRVVPVLHDAGLRTLAPDLTTGGDHGLHDDAKTVVAAIDRAGDDVVLVGHSYAGLVVREAADARPGLVRRVVLVDGWVGPDGAALVDLAPEAFGTAVRAAARERGDGWYVPAPPPAAYGITEPGDVTWLAERLVPQALRTFTEPTLLSGAVDGIPGTAVCCQPETYPFAEFAASVGYEVRALEGPHDVPLARPEPLARLLLEIFENGKREV
ncbi:alpha/beta fold hydrolase [Saccharothrix variisporea]|uniref:Alpha/beta hydrolase family protein n=1 Tax=Saccharothrix variisporea TaxID=543527 RepID=A0A495X2S9_9PSEU|nr:alpha/beta hydrolase family protein [Saccharothrix variisporea]RKT67806.1 alpha/beta hydrolase family protein [Saccharothrix variisporea]